MTGRREVAVVEEEPGRRREGEKEGEAWWG